MENSRIEEFRLLATIGKAGRKSAAILELCDEIGKLTRRREFKAPKIEDVIAYGKVMPWKVDYTNQTGQVTGMANGIGISENECEEFFDHHETFEWTAKKGRIRNWKAALRTWHRNTIKFAKASNGNAIKKEHSRWMEFLKDTASKYRGEHRYAPEYLRLEFSRWLKGK